jgi:hypothetical protein
MCHGITSDIISDIVTLAVSPFLRDSAGMRERDKSAGRTANENYAAGLRFSQRIAAVWVEKFPWALCVLFGSELPQ